MALSISGGSRDGGRPPPSRLPPEIESAMEHLAGRHAEAIEGVAQHFHHELQRIVPCFGFFLLQGTFSTESAAPPRFKRAAMIAVV